MSILQKRTAKNAAGTVKDRGMGDIRIFADNGGPFHVLSGQETRQWVDSDGNVYGKTFEAVCLENGLDPLADIEK